MIAIIPTPPTTNEDEIIFVRAMGRLQVGRVYDPGSTLHGRLVMKTAYTGPDRHEIVDLTNPSAEPWFIDSQCARRVILLPPGESVTLTVFNEE